MKKFTLILVAIVLLLNSNVVAQNSQDCTITYNLFKRRISDKKVRCCTIKACYFNE